jgi:hypothetical protein
VELCLYTDSVESLSFEEALDLAARLGRVDPPIRRFLLRAYRRDLPAGHVYVRAPATARRDDRPALDPEFEAHAAETSGVTA